MYVTHYYYMVHKNMWNIEYLHVSNQSFCLIKILSIKSVQDFSKFKYTDKYTDMY